MDFIYIFLRRELFKNIRVQEIEKLGRLKQNCYVQHILVNINPLT